MAYAYLAVAIIAEVFGTSALKLSDGMTRPAYTLAVIAGYGLAFYMLSLTLRTIPVGIAYAIWCGVGIALITLIGLVFFKQPLDTPALVGIGFILLGVTIIYGFSSSTA